KNADGTGGIVRIKSGYQLRNITQRTHHADGSNVNDGPPVDATYFLGYFREDYEFINHPEEEFLDEHNGRFCKTPEYPNGTYAYFATVDADWNSAYPYVVGPTFYGNYENRKVETVDETTTVFTGATSISASDFNALNISVFPNPSTDLIAVQINDLVRENMEVTLTDLSGKQIATSRIEAGTTIAYFDVQTVYEGTYLITISNGKNKLTKKVTILRD
ncbi:MAG: YHYH protein, partial [Bacteroidia bacterium]